MENVSPLYDTFAALFRYPDGNYKSHLNELVQLSRGGSDAGIAEYVDQFAAAVKSLTREELEELYTRTFDINPVCSLELGWHLFGETYERGKFLVLMRALLKRYNVQESAELPDHLTHVLSLISRTGQHDAVVFAQRYLFPAITKMLAGFNDTVSPYKLLLLGLKTAAEFQFIQGVGNNV